MSTFTALKSVSARCAGFTTPCTSRCAQTKGAQAPTTNEATYTNASIVSRVAFHGVGDRASPARLRLAAVQMGKRASGAQTPISSETDEISAGLGKKRARNAGFERAGQTPLNSNRKSVGLLSTPIFLRYFPR
jgi:hypothetical protein